VILLLVNQQGAPPPSGGNPKAFEDVTTVYVAHLAVLRAANPGADLTTLASKDLVTIRAASVNNADDLTTAIAEYLLSNN
jgi:hypothetical protein